METNLSDFWFVLGFLMYFLGIYGVLIIPKWLINDSGPIAILLDDFWNLENVF